MNKISLLIFSLLLNTFFYSCSDWNEVEALNIKHINIEANNSELYSKYLKNLREYKKTDHRFVYGWFNNRAKYTSSRAQHFTSLPDSLDVVIVMFPDNLANFELEEMKEIRAKKGTNFIYNIDYEKIKAEYIKNTTDKNIELIDTITFIPFLSESIKKQLKIAEKYNYDGILVNYIGKRSLHMSDDERRIYEKCQNLFFSTIMNWQNLNKEKKIVFEGNIENIIDKKILFHYNHIILSTLNVNSTYGLTYSLLNCLSKEVPNDRFIVSISALSNDKTDKTTGYFIGENNPIAITEAAFWTTIPAKNYKKVGICIFNIQNDYYNSFQTYNYTNEAIKIMNSSFIN